MSIKDFQIISKLGEGAYSSVYKVKRISDENEYALKKVKIMNLSEKERQNALNEVRILASIRHPNIVQYKEAFIEETSTSLCIIMEFLDSGDLYQRIVDLQSQGTLMKENEIWNIFIQMVQGLRALHELKIYHRDMKSANIFLGKDGVAKLGDLNVSKVAKKGLLYTQTGTPYYASPEVWKDQPYDHKSDIWSLGCVLYEMTTLNPPFRAEDMEGLYKKVLRGYFPRVPSIFSQDLNNVIRALLQVSPQLRPNCDRLLQLPAVIKRMEEKHFMEADEQNILLTTIRLPKNVHFLTDRLPKANYEPIRTRHIGKSRFLATLAGYKDIHSHRGLQEFESRLMKGSESVDTHRRDKLPSLQSNKEEIFKIYNNNPKDKGKKQRRNPNHVMQNLENLNDVNTDQDSLDQNEVKIEAEIRRGRQKETRPRMNNAISEPPERYPPKELEQEHMSLGPINKPTGKNIHGYAVHNLNNDVIFDENSGGYNGNNNIQRGSHKASKKGLSDVAKYQNSPYASRKKHQNSENYKVEKLNARPLEPISKVGKLPSLGQPKLSQHQQESSSYKKHKPYRPNIGHLEDVNDTNMANKPRDLLPKKELYRDNYTTKT